MPRNYTRKTTRGQTSFAEMEIAAAEVMQGKKSLRKAGRDRNIDKTTLKRFIKKKEKGEVKSVAWGAVAEAKRIFTDEMEEELANQLKQLADQFHGLAPVKCRKLAFEYAEKNNIPVPANWTEKRCAGVEWFGSFLARRHLSVRTPEATSLGRATAINKTTEGERFGNLAVWMDSGHTFRPHMIYNVDETGVLTVQKPRQRQEHLSRVYDEVMDLGDFAESSRGSATSSKSGGQEEMKAVEGTSGHEEQQPVEEKDSNGSRQEENMDELVVESPFPRISSPPSGQPSAFNLRINEGGGGGKGGGGSGGAAFDDALDGLPLYEPEEDNKDWHFALPMGSLEDVDVNKANRKKNKADKGNNSSRGDPFTNEPKGEEKDESIESANTSHSSQDNTPDNSRVPAVIPALPPVPGSVRCSGCFKVLLKGQTPLQRKGSMQLFCSTVCLIGHLPPTPNNRLCFQCNRGFIQAGNRITLQVDKNTYMHFCGQFCLSVFRDKKKYNEKPLDKGVEKKPEKPPEKPVEKPFCSVCKVTNKIEHEVTLQGRVHRLCGDACFVTWRKMRLLAMKCFAKCGLKCNGSCQPPKVERYQLNFCSPTCIGAYKQTCRKTVDCIYCRKMRLVSATVMELDQKGKVQLYCSPLCVKLSRSSRHRLSGTPLSCSQCKVTAVPQYHLAMVDGTIRNFCCSDCVSIYRKTGQPSQPDLTSETFSLSDPSIGDAVKQGPSAGASSVPPILQDHPSSVQYPGHHPSHTSVPPVVPPYMATSSPSVPGQALTTVPPGQSSTTTEGAHIDTSILTCHQCSKHFSNKLTQYSHQIFCGERSIENETGLHQEHLSRVFDEVMGLGDFAESSRGSATSSKSGGQEETKAVDETSGQEEQQPVEEEDSNGSRQEEKMDEGVVESPFPRISSPPSGQPSAFTLRTNEGGGRGKGGGVSGGAAFDDALDGLPLYEPEEEDEDWHFALPMGSLEDVDVDKANRKKSKADKGNNSSRGDPFTNEPEGGEKDESTESANTSHSSQDNTPDNSRDGGPLNEGEETDDSQQGERSEAAPVEDSNPPMSPTINIKDEPIDEGYDAALLPQSSIRQIKEELEHQEEELRISSVYSVGGANTFVSPTVPAAIPAPPPAAIFIPGRGTVLQAMTQLPVRPAISIPGPLPALAAAPQRPPHPPVPGSVRCSGCSKVLLKGQTAFQRKGSTQLFCSTVCLTGHLPPTPKNRLCFQCNREILQPRDMITIPADDNTYMNFCGQFCLSVFRHKRKLNEKPLDKRVEKKPEKPPEKPVERQPEKPFCSVCKVTNKIEHEVTHQGRLHRLCGDACFVTWRKMRHLAMNCCEGCGLYCNSNSGSCQTLTVERSQLNFCSPTCIGTYKQTCRKTVDCVYCHKMAVVSATIMERDQRGKVQLYCSPICVEQSRPPRHMLSGTPFPCSLCKVTAVPQYHLAMVDGTIRNFCSYDCVSIYRKTGHPAQPDLTNGTFSLRDPSIRDAVKLGPSAGASSVPPIPQDYPSSVPYPGHHPSHTSVPPVVPPYMAKSSPSVPGQALTGVPPGQSSKTTEGGHIDTSILTCHQCSKHFSNKPTLFSHQGRISMFCSTTCCEQYKTQKNILAVCECCKREKVPFEILSNNQQELVFCSENCKTLYKHELTSSNKDHTWRPCSYCSSISQKMLHSHYGGKIEEFCKPNCMSQYTVIYYGMGRCDSCRKQGHMAEKLQCLGSVRNFCHLPCLLHYCHHHFETSQNSNSNGTGTAPQTPYGALPASIDGKNLDHASTQTDAMRVPVSRRRQMKNKSVLCRPFTMDQETMCQLPTSSTESEAQSSPSVTTSAREENVKVIFVPVPIPVFIPVPMNMYSQYTPVPMAMPMPVPVPIVVPPQNKDMKDATVQSEPWDLKKEKHSDQPVSSADQGSSSADVESQVVDPVIHEKEDTLKAVQADLPLSSERSRESSEPQLDVKPESTTTSDPPITSAEHQPPSSPVMDLETDFPSVSVVPKSTAPQRGVKRPREGFSGRKRGRRRTVLDRSAVEPPAAASKLNHLYGVKAWKCWVQLRNKQSQQSTLVDIKEDILQCDSAELSFALSRFIREVRRPNGEPYSPDSIFYLCLGIQQYLFMKGRIENIFTDELYSHFATEITGMLQFWKPKLLPSGGIVSSRVEESYLWECKQLGAYSPIVLLNTLLFFCTKTFHLTTLAQHQSLSFVNFTRRSKPCSRAGKVHYLQYQRSSSATPSREDTERHRRRQTDNEGSMEMPENVTNPLHCPVRLYEFYLSRCPESVKKRSDVFYLQPEQIVHTHSSHWYTSQPLEGATLQTMLTRILAVREVNQAQGAAQHQSSATTVDSSLQ
ncbi:zinc finger MYM-type protein 4-like isoform X3 [Platichthys flesus]|uniref:zinc finger MYM-type protein 4-like isoform X3 n=1 Tax=Platichthys flesus TaxID=8260 RepID=UPI002DB95FA2|nr:zinc finger MYM-type protein 4-like isoform X3 [Platichthys flesus]